MMVMCVGGVGSVGVDDVVVFYVGDVGVDVGDAIIFVVLVSV